jgi:DNA-binding transcriptional LysR family regulator
VVDLVAEGFDFALRAAPMPDSALVARKLAPVEVGLWAAPAYLGRRGIPAAVAALAEHDCVLFRPDRGRATWMLQGPAGEERVVVKGPVGADDFTFVQRIVLAGTGIGLLPSFLCQAAAREGDLVRVLPDHALRAGTFQLVYPSARYLPHRAAVFRDFLIAALGAEREEAGR